MGKIDILWFDFSYLGDNSSITSMTTEKANLNGNREPIATARKLQPDILITTADIEQDL